MPDFFLTEDIGKFKLLAWIKSARHHIGNMQDVFVEKTTGLGYHTALVVPGTKLLFNEIEIPDDIVLIDLNRRFVIVKCENVTHFSNVIPDCPR
jgi:hypothetical protein